MTKLEWPPQRPPEWSEAQSKDPVELPLSFQRRDGKPGLAPLCGSVAALISLGMTGVYSFLCNSSFLVGFIETPRSK